MRLMLPTVSQRNLALAALAAFAAMTGTLRGRRDGGTSESAPPRVKSGKPFFEHADLTLRAAKPTRYGVPAREFLHASYAVITIFDAIPGKPRWAT